MRPFFILLAVSSFVGLTEAAGERVIVVAPPSNLTGNADYQALETALQHLLITSLGRSDVAAVVERENLAVLLREQKLGLEGRIDPAMAAKTGKLIGANLVVLGSFLLVDGKLRVDYRAVDVATSAVVAAAQVTERPAELIQIGDQLGEQLLKALQLKPDKAKASKVEVEMSPDANLHFLRGLGFYYSTQYAEAISEFSAAVQLDRKQLDALFWSGRSYLAQKEYAHAKVKLDHFLERARGHPQYGLAGQLLAECEKHLTTDERAFFSELRKNAVSK